MGVDTGKQLHVVILEPDTRGDDAPDRLIKLVVCDTFEELDGLMERYQVCICVIDGLPETHATRAFAQRHWGAVYLNFFNEHQRGSAKWGEPELAVQINRTEALDASRAAIRDRRVILPRREPIVELSARHRAADARILDEDEETGAKKYRYLRVGEDHFSLAFTYAWMGIPELPGRLGRPTRMASVLQQFIGYHGRNGRAGPFDSF